MKTESKLTIDPYNFQKDERKFQDQYEQHHHNSDKPFHCIKCNKCVDKNPLQFDLIDYLKETQNNEFNAFNILEHPNQNDTNFQTTNKVSEMLVLSNLFFFKGINVYQEIMQKEKDLLLGKSTISDLEKELEHSKEIVENFKKLEGQLVASEEVNIKNSKRITDLELERNFDQTTINELQKQVKELQEEAKKFVNMDNLIDKINEQEFIIKSDSQLIRRYEEGKKQLEDQSKIINKFVERLQDELKQAKENVMEKEKTCKEVKDETTKFENKLIEKESLIKHLNKEKENIKIQLLEDIKIVKREKERVITEIEKLMASNADLTKELNTMKTSEDTLKNTTALNEILEVRVNQKQMEISSLEAQIKKNRSNTKSLEENIATLNKMIENLTIENKKLLKDLNNPENKKMQKENYEKVSTLTNDTNLQTKPKRRSVSSKESPRKYHESKVSQFSSPQHPLIRSQSTFNNFTFLDQTGDFLQTDAAGQKKNTIEINKTPSSQILMTSQNEQPKILSQFRKKNSELIEKRKNVTFDLKTTKLSLENMFMNLSKSFVNKSDQVETLSFKNNLSGNWKCAFKIVRMTYGIHIGICSSKIQLSELKSREFLGKHQQEWALNAFSGYLWRNGNKYKKIDKVFKSGDVIEMILDNGNLAFKNQGVTYQTFKGINESVYPAVTIFKNDDAVEIISIE